MQSEKLYTKVFNINNYNILKLVNWASMNFKLVYWKDKKSTIVAKTFFT